MASDAQIKASTKYNRKQDNIMIRPNKEEGMLIRDAAKNADESLQVYILQAVRERIRNDADKDMQNVEENDRAQDQDSGESREGCLPL